MAKLKAPLMSLGASGALGKALVFFGWKGLDVVREYVVPANPKTDPQKLQRGYLTDAVTLIHLALARDPNPMDEEDIMAMALLASIRPTPRTWFNELVKQWLDQQRLGRAWIAWINGHLTPGVDELEFQITDKLWQAFLPTDGHILYGTSKTALIHSVDATPDQMIAGVTIPNLVTGTKYYAQYRPDTPADTVGSNSGIYYGVPT